MSERFVIIDEVGIWPGDMQEIPQPISGAKCVFAGPLRCKSWVHELLLGGNNPNKERGE